MKVWVKFNGGFQLYPPDFNFAPRSREAGDAPGSATPIEMPALTKMRQKSLYLQLRCLLASSRTTVHAYNNSNLQ